MLCSGCEIFLGGNRRKRAVHKRQTARTFRAATVDGQRDAVFSCAEIIEIADLERARLNIHLGHANCTGFAGVRDRGVAGCYNIAIY